MDTNLPLAQLIAQLNLAGFPLVSYVRGVELFCQDTQSETVYIIADGSVKLSRFEADGRQSIAAVYSTGYILGAAPLLCRRPHPLTAVTVSYCRLVPIEGSRLLSLLQTDREIAALVFRSQASEAVDYALRLSKLACFSARQELLALLGGMLSQGGYLKAGANVRLQFTMRRYEVAESMGITPQHLSRRLRQLEREGLIRQEKGWIIIPNPARFRDT